MPYKCVKRGEKFRVVKPSGEVAKNAAGTALDGGGHSSKAACSAQVRALYANEGGKK